MGSQNVCYICASHSYKLAHQPLYANNSALNGGIVIVYRFMNDLSGDGFFFRIRYHVECQWEKIGCYGIIAVILFFLIPEGLVETFFYVFCQFPIFLNILS